ncbi:hypothetical protein [Haloarcula sp. JP-L23]|uniref:DUF7504 family protein n=1 Tax=Haloarcula sp. JP-L23 TaxID=2716717 RepID=UPI00140F3530|nr:hypothetical protein G9465_12520 [Haloarcula sp. JP-L23]
MSSNRDTTGVRELRLDPGAQALLSLDTMQSPFRELPPSAYANLLVVSSTAPDDVASVLDDAGADLSRVGQIPITGSEVDYDGPMWTSDPVVPDDLTGLSMRLSRVVNSLGAGRGWLVFDNLNVFLLYAREERVLRFFDHVATLARNHEIYGVYTLVRDAIDDQTYERIRRSFDVEVDRR